MSRSTFQRYLLIGLLVVVASVRCVYSGELHGVVRYQQTAKIVSELLPARHVTARQLDDEISTRAFGRFIRELDPDLSIFLPADIQEFESFRWRLDDDLREGNLHFPDLVYKRLQERINASKPPTAGNGGLGEEERFTLFLNSLTQAYDPHTIYRMPTIQARDKVEHLTQGIGAALAIEGGKVVVRSIVPGGAADTDGRLQKGDMIISIQQQNSSNAVVVTGLELDEVVRMIRGEIGSTVSLLIERDCEILDIQLVRAKIQLQEPLARGEVLERFSETNNTQYRIGVIELPSFYTHESKNRDVDTSGLSVSQDLKRLLERFASESVDAVVLDLSANYQGALVEAVTCAGLFIDRGPIVQVKDSKGVLQTLSDENAGASWEGPLIVLTSKESTSASEVFAGAMRCYERALIVGDPKTHGKGTVQSILELSEHIFDNTDKSDYGSLKITTKKYYFPDGTSNQKFGVSADIVLRNPRPSDSPSEADLPFALLPDSVETIPFRKYGAISEGLRTELKDRMATRRLHLGHGEVSQQPSPATIKQKGRIASTPYHEEFLHIAMDYLSYRAKQ